MNAHKRWMTAGSALLLGTVLSGCSANLDEVQAWMDNTRNDTPRKVGKLDEPKNFVPFRYEAKLDYRPLLGQQAGGGHGQPERPQPFGPGAGPQPPQGSARELPAGLREAGGSPAEQNQRNVALLAVDDVVYQARVGNYVGQNYGRITRITETEMGVKELVRDAAGDWVEQDTTLSLEDEPKS